MAAFKSGLYKHHWRAMQFMKSLPITPYHYSTAVNYQEKTKTAIKLLTAIYLPFFSDLFHVVLMREQTCVDNRHAVL